ncbi:MAG: TRAP transporter TatT component family protein [Spirochaetaceae bacterium]
MMHKVGTVAVLGTVVLALALSGCSINRLAVRVASNALTGTGEANVFMTDNDPELIAEALPFALKLYDTLLQQDPENDELLLSTGSAYVSYANAFLQTPANQLPPGEFERKERMLERAKNLYLRGRAMTLKALEVRHPGFMENLENGDFAAITSQTTREDVPYLYWSAAGWMGAFSTDPFDLDLGLSIKGAASLMDRAYELNPTFDEGAIHEFYISYYASLPAGLGGDRAKAREHFERAEEIADGKKASPYVSLATAVSIPEQNVSEFRDLMNKALAIDVELYPEYRLINTIKQREAAWYLDSIERFFVVTEEEATS